MDHDWTAERPPIRKWQPADHPPEAYELAILSFPDGTTFRGTWTGKIWWGYDPRTKRSGKLQPVAWLPWG